jgi:hypothetical protein
LMADKLMRRRSRGQPEGACEVSRAHAGDFHHARQPTCVKRLVCASRRALANVSGGVFVDEMCRERESKLAMKRLAPNQRNQNSALRSVGR